MQSPATETLAAHRLDGVSFGKIVQIRETLLRAQAKGARVIRFESGDPSFSVPPHVLGAISEAGRAGKTHYVPNDGIPELRRALAEKLRVKNGVDGVLPRDVFLTNGAMHALYVTFGTLLSDGDEVIIPDPMWTEVAENIRLAGGVPVARRARRGRRLRVRARSGRARDHAGHPRDLHQYAAQSDRRGARSITLKALVALAREHDLWIVSDEAYEDVALRAELALLRRARVAGDWADRVISVFSFSKSHAMSGLRVGYIVTRSAVAAGANSEAAAVHDQRREQPRAVGRARGDHGTAGSPAGDARRVSSAARHADRSARGIFPACDRSRREARSTSGPSSIRRSTRDSACRAPTSYRRSLPRTASAARRATRSVSSAPTRFGSRSAATRRWFAPAREVLRGALTGEAAL